MATKTLYGSKPELREIEQLFLEIGVILHPHKENQAVMLVKGLKAYKKNLQEEKSE